MKKILSIIRYVSEVIQAIAKGAEVANDNWPTDNPFKSPSVADSEVSKQQGTISQ